LIKAAEAGGGEVCDGSTAKIEILARLKKGRDVDPVLSVGVEFPDGSSTCSQAVLLCQDRLGDGVRGDESADPIDRRAARRLVHCNSMTVSSLTCLDDEPVILEEMGQSLGRGLIWEDSLVWLRMNLRMLTVRLMVPRTVIQAGLLIDTTNGSSFNMRKDR